MSKTEKQKIKLEKVDDKTAYVNLLVKYAELENKITDIKANCDLAIEGRDIKIKELEQEVERLKNLGLENINKYEQWHLTDRRTIAELEKENAELKQKNLAYKDAVDMQMYTNKANKEIANRKLTKAKELLKKWIDLHLTTSVQTETKQFLKEIEK